MMRGALSLQKQLLFEKEGVVFGFPSKGKELYALPEHRLCCCTSNPSSNPVMPLCLLLDAAFAFKLDLDLPKTSRRVDMIYPADGHACWIYICWNDIPVGWIYPAD